MATHPYNSCDFKADLYARDTPAASEQILLLCDTTLGDIPPSLWGWDASSPASDNFTGGVVKPTNTVGNGRWIRQLSWPATPKKQETFLGTTSGAGNYTVTFGTAYATAPDVQPQIINPTDNQFVRVTAVSTTGFTINARSRTDALGLLPTFSNLNGVSISVLVTAR
jgi:hypothetical protein